MKQSRSTSLIESIANVIAGVGVACVAQIIIFPWFGIHIALIATFQIALVMTGISIVRQYILRRLFEHLRVTGVMP
jgi:hypothetical protein